MVFLNLKLSRENEHTDHHYSGELLNLWVVGNNSAQSEEEENDEWVRFEENVLCVLEVVPIYLVSAHVVRLNEGEEICEGKGGLERGEEIFLVISWVISWVTELGKFEVIFEVRNVEVTFEERNGVIDDIELENEEESRLDKDEDNQIVDILHFDKNLGFCGSLDFWLVHHTLVVDHNNLVFVEYRDNNQNHYIDQDTDVHHIAYRIWARHVAHPNIDRRWGDLLDDLVVQFFRNGLPYNVYRHDGLGRHLFS